MILIFGVFYLLLIRPQQKKQRELQATIAELKAGDKVITTGGIVGIITAVRDTSGAGDVFHGAYVYSYLDNPQRRWEQHFQFAQRAATFKIQHLGNEAGLPTLADIDAVAREFDAPAAAPTRPARRTAARG